MSSQLDELDKTIGEALDQISEAGALVRANDVLDTSEYLRPIGKAIIALWDLRDSLHEIAPELKSEMQTEYAEDKTRFEELTEIHNLAYIFERKSDFDEAENAYENLLVKSNLGHFKRLAEAGLYRVKKANKNK